jgi:hypothetical protein
MDADTWALAGRQTGGSITKHVPLESPALFFGPQGLVLQHVALETRRETSG